MHQTLTWSISSTMVDSRYSPIDAAHVNPRCDVADSGGNPGISETRFTTGSASGRDQVRMELRADFDGPIFSQKDLISPLCAPLLTAFVRPDKRISDSHDEPFDQLYHRAPESLPDTVFLGPTRGLRSPLL